jgi:hypothetical protein
MATAKPDTDTTAPSIDDFVTTDGVSNSAKAFVRAGAIRIINNQCFLTGDADLVGNRPVADTSRETLSKANPMRAFYALAPAYDEVEIGGTWMKIADAAKNGLPGNSNYDVTNQASLARASSEDTLAGHDPRSEFPI